MSPFPTIHMAPIVLGRPHAVTSRSVTPQPMVRVTPGFAPPVIPVPSGPHPGPSGGWGLRQRNPPVTGGYPMQQAVPIAMTDPPVATPSSIQMYAQGVADIFALEWVPLSQGGLCEDPAFAAITGGSAAFSAALTFSSMGGTVDSTGKNVLHGGPLFSASPIRSPEWWHVTVHANELLQILGDPEPTLQQILAAPRRSILRVRVRWNQRNGYEQFIDADIGNGLEMYVPPTPQLDIILLVPNPASTPTPVGAADLKYPPWFSAPTNPEIPNYLYSTAITATAYPVCSPVDKPPNTVTFTAFSSQVDAGAGVFPVIPIPPGALFVQAESDDVATNPIFHFLFDQTNPASVISSFSFPAGSRTTEKVMVPKHAQAIRVLAGGNVDRTLTINFELHQ